MTPRTMSRSALQTWVQSLIGGHRVIGVQARGDRFVYDDLRRAEDLRLDHDVTVLPPKKYFQLPREVLLTFDPQGTFQPSAPDGPFVLFGVHPYDVAAIAQMDQVFSKDQYDAHYMARRKQAAIVACDVENASPNVFAGCMGTAVVTEGCDVLLTRVGEAYVAEAFTPVGKKLLAEAGELPASDPVTLGRREQVWLDARRFLNRQQLRCAPSEIPALLDKSYDNPLWEKKAARCFSCGSCTMVCPTCFCFDVQDEVHWDLKSGVRTRTWDGCQLTDFALVAGNHNFRKHREQRYRHRFYRKGKYLWDRMKFIACVGCGRCATACTTGIASPVEVYNTLLEGQP